MTLRVTIFTKQFFLMLILQYFYIILYYIILYHIILYCITQYHPEILFTYCNMILYYIGWNHIIFNFLHKHYIVSLYEITSYNDSIRSYHITYWSIISLHILFYWPMFYRNSTIRNVRTMTSKKIH